MTGSDPHYLRRVGNGNIDLFAQHGAPAASLHVGQPLREAEFDELMSELEAYATEVFGEAEAARHWLDTNLWELDNLSPRQIVARAGRSGLDRARDVLLRIEYGVYS